MKRRTRHATRNLLSLLPRRSRRATAPPGDQVLRALRLSGKSALTIALAGLMLVFIGLLVANFVGQVMQSARLESQRTALEQEVATMEAATTRLSGAVAYAESDVYVERVARSQLGFAREGDVVILPRLAAATPTPAEAAPAEASPAAPPPAPNWQRWWQAFFPTTG